MLLLTIPIIKTGFDVGTCHPNPTYVSKNTSKQHHRPPKMTQYHPLTQIILSFCFCQCFTNEPLSVLLNFYLYNNVSWCTFEIILVVSLHLHSEGPPKMTFKSIQSTILQSDRPHIFRKWTPDSHSLFRISSVDLEHLLPARTSNIDLNYT